MTASASEAYAVLEQHQNRPPTVRQVSAHLSGVRPPDTSPQTLIRKHSIPTQRLTRAEPPGIPRAIPCSL